MLELSDCIWSGTINIKSNDLVLTKCIIKDAIVTLYNCEVFFENCTIKNCIIVMNGIMHIYDTMCVNSNFTFKELNKIDFRNSSYIDTLINISHEERCVICADSCTFIGIPFSIELANIIGAISGLPHGP